ESLGSLEATAGGRFLEVEEVQPSLVGAGGAGDGVAGLAKGLNEAALQDLVHLQAGVGVIQPGKGPSAVRGRGGGRVARGQRAAAVLVDKDDHAPQAVVPLTNPAV